MSLLDTEGWTGFPARSRHTVKSLVKLSICSYERASGSTAEISVFPRNQGLGNRAGNFSHMSTSTHLPVLITFFFIYACLLRSDVIILPCLLYSISLVSHLATVRARTHQANFCLFCNNICHQFVPKFSQATPNFKSVVVCLRAGQIVKFSAILKNG